jgi:hypothetical protein
MHLLRCVRLTCKNCCFLGLTADALISTGLAKLGYTYVNIGMLHSFCSLSFIMNVSFLLAQWEQEAEPNCYFLLSQMTAGLK